MDQEIREAERIARRSTLRQDWLRYAQLTYRAGRDPRVNPWPADIIKFGLNWWVEELDGLIVVLSPGSPKGWMHIQEWRKFGQRCILTGPPFIAYEKDWEKQFQYYQQQAAFVLPNP